MHSYMLGIYHLRMDYMYLSHQTNNYLCNYIKILNPYTICPYTILVIFINKIRSIIIIHT